MNDAVIIGGGLAGAALATKLASAGRQVELIEREAVAIDKVCGEFLSREAGFYLSSLGLDLPALGAVPIHRVRLCQDSHTTVAALPFSALGLSRRLLDEALLDRAKSAGVSIRRGVKVQAIHRVEDRWSARLADGSNVEAGAAFIATGKHDLHGFKRPLGTQNDLVAFKQIWKLNSKQAAELAGHVELVLFKGGYAGLQPIENNHVNLCLLIRRSSLSAIDRGFDSLISALCASSKHLSNRLGGAIACLAKPLALSAIPYGFVRRFSDGVWYLGDQAAVIPSFSGDGMSIALHSAALAGITFLKGENANVYQQKLAHDVTGQVRLATLLSLGIVRRPWQRMFGLAVHLWPSLIPRVATHTRVSDTALARLASPLRIER